jgi:hypothetical protein
VVPVRPATAARPIRSGTRIHTTTTAGWGGRARARSAARDLRRHQHRAGAVDGERRHADVHV